MNFTNTYAGLSEAFYEKNRPTPVANPALFLWNSSLAEALMVPAEWQNDPDRLAQVFSGNQLISGSEPIATVYAGHQFGNFAPRLGDGRAHLLGEVVDRCGQRVDIQLKGSGPTLYSRNGDGRCALGPAIREFIMSEAMNALGVPTTRCLAVVTTGEPVFRETSLPGAIVTRIASSHLRIGTCQFFAAQGDHQSLKTLCDYAIERHYPALREAEGNPYTLLVDKVAEKLIQLVVQWMRVGFIHGVMNTDNTTLSGETIDYGPCAMLGTYNPQTVYSSIDRAGRYAFGNQPDMAQWNIARFAESLLPLINADTQKAIDQVLPIITAFPQRFKQLYLEMIGRKLGLTSLQEEDQELLFSILKRLREKRLDYTVTFDLLTQSVTSANAASQLKNELGECFNLWQKRLQAQDTTAEEIQAGMSTLNPVVIPRNHHLEAVIQACEQSGKVESAEKFLQVLCSPYEEIAQTAAYQDQPADGDAHYQTYCGT